MQLCVYTSKPHLITQFIQATYAVPPCWCNHAFKHIKAAIPYTVYTGYIRCTSLLVQLCVYTSKSHLLTQCIQTTYAVPPCWCNYAFTYQSRTSLYRLHTLYLLAGAIMRLHIKVALTCSAYRLHTLYLLAGAIMRLHIKVALTCTVHTDYIRCTSLLVQLCVYISKPHFLIQATYAVPPCWCNYAFTHQSRTYLQCIQATYAVPPCWCNYAFTHQSRTYLHSAYRLHTLYLLAGAIMRLHIKAALPYTGYIRCTSLLVQLCVYTSKCTYLHSAYRPHTLYLLAGAIMRLHIKVALTCTVHTGHIRCTSLLVQLCVYISKPHFLIQTTYAVPPCRCNYSFTHESCTSSPVLKIIYVFCLAMYFRFRSHAKPAGGETGTKGDT